MLLSFENEFASKLAKLCEELFLPNGLLLQMSALLKFHNINEFNKHAQYALKLLQTAGLELYSGKFEAMLSVVQPNARLQFFIDILHLA